MFWFFLTLYWILDIVDGVVDIVNGVFDIRNVVLDTWNEILDIKGGASSFKSKTRDTYFNDLTELCLFSWAGG